MSSNVESSDVPFVWRDGEMVQLDDLIQEPWVATYIGFGAINDAGQIAVSAIIDGDPSGNKHALLLTPIEPTAVTGNAMPFGYTLSARAREITFSVPHATHVSIRVFDVGGRRLATLVDGVRSSGSHATVWSGQTIQGDRASSSIYFVKLETPAHTMTSKVVFVR